MQNSVKHKLGKLCSLLPMMKETLCRIGPEENRQMSKKVAQK